MALKHSFCLLLVLALLALSSAEYDNGGSNYDPKPYYALNPKPKPSLQNFLSNTIGIQGLVYCKSGRTKPFPLEGAVMRATCFTVDKYGYERSPFSFLSKASDKNGYFFATLCPSEVPPNRKITKCKVFLELSPLEDCDVPTDINKGISGAILSSYHLLPEKKINLFSVGPFFYTTTNPRKSGPIDHGY